MSNIRKLKKYVMDEGVKYLKIEGMLEDDALKNKNSEFFEKPEEYSLKVFDFFVCFDCSVPYYGGKHECAQGVEVYSFFFFLILSFFFGIEYLFHFISHFYFDSPFLLLFSFFRE